MLTLSGTSLRGAAGPRQIFCLVRPSTPALRIPPGTYQLVPGPSDPIHGTVLLLISGEAKAADYIVLKKKEVIVTSVASHGRRVEIAVAAKPISGRNCLIVDAGFNSLVDSVNASGSITVKVI